MLDCGWANLSFNFKLEFNTLSFLALQFISTKHSECCTLLPSEHRQTLLTCKVHSQTFLTFMFHSGTALTATYSTLHYGKRGGHNLSQLYENLFSSFWPTSSHPLWVAGDLCFTQKYFSYDPLSVKTSPTVLCGIPKSQLIWRSQ